MGNRGASKVNLSPAMLGFLPEWAYRRGSEVTQQPPEVKAAAIQIVDALVTERLQSFGARGLKRKRAYRRYKEARGSENVVQIVTEAVRLGVDFGEVERAIMLLRK